MDHLKLSKNSASTRRFTIISTLVRPTANRLQHPSLISAGLSLNTKVMIGHSKVTQLIIIFTVRKMEQMGPSGDTHFDAFDFSGVFSDAVSFGDVPDNFNPGCLFFLLAGVYVRLDEYVTVNFSGLHFHGGTSAVAPKGARLGGWESRLVSIGYSQSVTLEGQARYPLCAGPDNQTPIYVTPEMHLPE